jgi:hypothetical protein
MWVNDVFTTQRQLIEQAQLRLGWYISFNSERIPIYLEDQAMEIPFLQAVGTVNDARVKFTGL